ncbi:hypothetical protein DERP_009343 [Dermatophagoides pteronyssinus]|uniref:Uncharacterized protein n=1 Tax=Dermatophagoides pteronyssinus TaxID=6956 RepID=A0ABQ8ITR7_DERPT|nr:hypothetical protein DERP_009343 [Dermatophagoides pteronyssinus]
MATIFEMELNDSEIEDFSNSQSSSQQLINNNNQSRITGHNHNNNNHLQQNNHHTNRLLDYEIENDDQMIVNNEIEVKL